MDHNKSDVYCETRKILVGPLRTKGMECWHSV
jgi:hypothetical protein